MKTQEINNLTPGIPKIRKHTHKHKQSLPPTTKQNNMNNNHFFIDFSQYECLILPNLKKKSQTIKEEK